MPGPKMGKMLSQANNAIKRFVIPFGRVASGTSTKLNIQKTANGEVREVKVVAPYGVQDIPVHQGVHPLGGTPGDSRPCGR